jgi:hypothetical protein
MYTAAGILLVATRVLVLVLVIGEGERSVYASTPFPGTESLPLMSRLLEINPAIHGRLVIHVHVPAGTYLQLTRSIYCYSYLYL